MRKLILKSILLAFIFMIASCSEKGQSTSEIVTITKEKTYPFSLEYDTKIDSLISEMTTEEKVAMLHSNSMFTSAGIERFGIPELKMADGPLGIREELGRNSWAPLGIDTDFATFFPAGGGLSATWNTELAALYGKSIGAEARARGKDVLLAPAFNIIRTPICGRNFEYFSEDPFLNKRFVVPYVNGVQSQNIAVSIKHYAVNNQEQNRGRVDVLMDERTLREIYLPAFKAAVVDANAYTVMGAYNKFRGHYLCENDYLLNTILKGEWGFKGIVISDWGAVHSTVKSLENGLDIEMGSFRPYLGQPLLDSLAAGAISESIIDEKVKRILRVMYSVKSIDSVGRAVGSINTKEHLDATYKMASESVVLLKNSENILPIDVSTIKSIAVIGDNATRKHAAGGFGAGVKTKNEVSPLEGLENRLPEGVTINYAQGYKEIYAEGEESKQQFRRKSSNDIDPEMIAEAVEAAKNSDVAIIFAGSNRLVESEAIDRENMGLPFGQNELIKKVKEANPNTIVVIIAGAPFNLNEVDKTNTVLWSWFNGSEAGNALADIILGNVNPSGKLPWTLPKKLSDSPAHATNSYPGDSLVTYKEGILVGYRWFDTKNIEPLYPFGYGLSYTNYEYSDLKTNKESYTKDEVIKIEFTIENTGNIDGKEVAQLYISDPESSVEKATKELKGFTKVLVKNGESTNATILVDTKEFAYYDETQNQWIVESGTYNLKVGASSRDIKSEITITIN